VEYTTSHLHWHGFVRRLDHCVRAHKIAKERRWDESTLSGNRTATAGKQEDRTTKDTHVRLQG
jgi:hypothetical protein